MRSKKFLFMSSYGIPFVLLALTMSLLFAFLSIIVYKPAILGLSALFMVFCVFFAWFFRDPDRKPAQAEDVVISPADGKIVEVSDQTGGILDESMKNYKKLSIFMSVFDVHVNRIPLDGTLTEVTYSKGKFYPADRHVASKNNESNLLLIENGQKNYKYAVRQIAGLLARRIVSWVEKGESVRMGERFGIILFGSRVEVFLPESFRYTVKEGDRVKAGKTVIGRRN